MFEFLLIIFGQTSEQIQISSETTKLLWGILNMFWDIPNMFGLFLKGFGLFSLCWVLISVSSIQVLFLE